MAAKSRSAKSSSGGGKLFLGVLLGLGLAAGGYWLWNNSRTIQGFFGKQSAPLPPQKPTPTPVLTKRMAQAAKDAPFSPSEDVFEAAAHTFVAKCSKCHGRPGADARKKTDASQFWNRRSAALFDAQSTGEIYDNIASGLPEKGMPAFANNLTQTQIWQLALLLKSDNLELPDPVRQILVTK